MITSLTEICGERVEARQLVADDVGLHVNPLTERRLVQELDVVDREAEEPRPGLGRSAAPFTQPRSPGTSRGTASVLREPPWPA
jgi:hypothetical protein